MRLHEQFHIPENWALDAFGRNELQRAARIAERLILGRSLGSVLELVDEVGVEDLDLIEAAVHTCEVAALEWWQAARYPTEDNVDDQKSLAQVCGLAFTLLQSLPVPSTSEAKVSHVLRVVALGYLADRATDVKRWVTDVEPQLCAELGEWNGRLISRIMETWVRLVRRKDWDDVHAIARVISDLRKEQHEKEPQYLRAQEEGSPSASWELVSLYHWARATEVLAGYMLQGMPSDAEGILDLHFEKAYLAAEQSGAFELGNLLRWLHLASHRFVRNALWNVSKRFNSNITRYVKQLVTSNRTTLELLPPQRQAIFAEGLLDRTHNAIVVSLPTSSGKTNLAIFRILEAINHFGEGRGWIAYTAPTRALVNQVSVRLRRELAPLKIRVERLSGAAEVDQLEEDVLGDENAFHVLVCTPEKLDVVIRQQKVKRDLVLFIMDEAHSIEEERRGLKHELLLAMVKRDCPSAKFLLLTPFVSNGREIARWLDPQAPGSIGVSLDWKPNDRVIGKFWATAGSKPRNWRMTFESLSTTHPSLEFDRQVTVGGAGPLNKPFSQVKDSLTALACAMAAQLQIRGTVLVITQKKNDAWSAAEHLRAVLPEVKKVAPEVESVIRFLEAEYGPDYDLASLLRHGIAVHHSGLSEEARFLVEWLTEESHVRVLCATTTIAQGINFPVSSILLASVKYPYGNEMKYREFWNLVGRAGRLGQPGVGLIGLASRDGSFGPDADLIDKYLKGAHGALLSSLLTLYADAKARYGEINLSLLAYLPTWSAFLQYLAHLFNQSDRDRVLGTQLERTLRDTLGFISLERTDPAAARELVTAVRNYVAKLNPGIAKLAEDTGFAPENVSRAIQAIKDERIQPSDWRADRLFADQGTLRKLMGVMLRIPELGHLTEISSSGVHHSMLAGLTTDWVNGKSLKDLAQEYFRGTDANALTKCCDAIYGKLVNNATWGLASLQKLGVDFDRLSEAERRGLNVLPAMIYYGVNTEEAVLMRMNGVPRSLAKLAGAEYNRQKGSTSEMTPQDALAWLSNLDASTWGTMLPGDYPMTGADCQAVWQKLSGVQ